MRRQFYVNIMANERRTIYTGVTNDLLRRVWQHKNKQTPGFTTKYDCTMLVYYEATDDIRDAIEREKRIKDWLRARKLARVTSANPKWKDLSLELSAQETWTSLPDSRFAQNDRRSSAGSEVPVSPERAPWQRWR